MSAYFAYHLSDATTQKTAAVFSGNLEICYEYSVLSNIYSGGLPPVEAGSVIAEKAFEILQHNAAGNRLESLLQTHSI
jgi:ethanolamine ammonia-lyase large subunit